MLQDKFYKKEWVSTSILKLPRIYENKIHKGAIIINQVDPLLYLYPNLRRFFFIIERHGWYGAGEATQADIKMVEDLSTINSSQLEMPDIIHLDIADADFVDTCSFYPVQSEIKYDVIQIACWSPRKRIELLIHAASLLPNLKFIHFGHFENNGTTEELKYKKKCIKLASRIAKNFHIAFSACNSNDSLPNNKDLINSYINSAKIGVLTTTMEGVNRFKLECLSSNRPCLVSIDSGATGLKHTNLQTGTLFQPNSTDLAHKIHYTINNIHQYSPRVYVSKNTGIEKSLTKLKSAIRTLCMKTNQDYFHDDIYYDGRNESLNWGNAGIDEIEATLNELNTHKELEAI